MSFPSTQLFVGHLNPSTSYKDFERRFGYGFIEYDDYRDAEDAISGEHQSNFQGNRIVVEWAKGSGRYEDKGSRMDKSRDYRRKDDGDRDRDRDRDRRRRPSPEYRRRSRERDRERERYRNRKRSPSSDSKSSGKTRSRSRSISRSRSRSGSYKKRN